MSKKSPELFVQAPVSTNTPAVEPTPVYIPTAIKPAEHVFFTVVPTAPQSTEHFVPASVYIPTAVESAEHFVTSIFIIPATVEST